MRKALVSALMITCLVLSGCGSNHEQQVESARRRLTAADAVSLTAQVQVDLGTTMETFRLEHGYDGDTWTVQVTEPSFLSGITARITEQGSELEYDGAVLTTGPLTDTGIAPIAAVPLIWETMAVGTVDSVWTEGELLVCKLIYDEDISVTVWFSDGIPAAAELAEHGIVKAVCTMTNVQIKEATNFGTTENEDLGGNQSGESGM